MQSILSTFTGLTRPLPLAAVLLGNLMLFVGCESQAAKTKTDEPPAPDSATIKIDFHGALAEIETEFEFTDRATVFDALEYICHEFEIGLAARGKGETAFVVAIAGMRNEGSSGDNWVYLVNDVLGDVSSDAFEIKDGDQILWRFGEYK